MAMPLWSCVGAQGIPANNRRRNRRNDNRYRELERSHECQTMSKPFAALLDPPLPWIASEGLTSRRTIDDELKLDFETVLLCRCRHV